MHLKASDNEKALVVTTAERTATVCMNIMTCIRRPMMDAKYFTTSDSLNGPLLLTSTRTSEIAYAFAEVSCTLSSISIYARTNSFICELTYDFCFHNSEIFSHKQFRIASLQPVPDSSIHVQPNKVLKAVDIPVSIVEIYDPYFDNE